jgi:hypothetical protein
MLKVWSVRFVSFSILFFTVRIPYTHAHLQAYCLLLSLVDMIYCTPETKATPASV